MSALAVIILCLVGFGLASFVAAMLLYRARPTDPDAPFTGDDCDA